MADERDFTGLPPKNRQSRHLDAIPEYSLTPRDEMERTVRSMFREYASEFRSEEQIIKLIDQRTAQRWRNVGLTVSANPFEGGELEENVRRMVEHLKLSMKDAADSKGKVWRRMQAVLVSLGALGTFLGVIYGFFVYLAAHIK